MNEWNPSHLSGGQKQRVAQLELLLINLVLMDEPTGALDEKIGMRYYKFYKFESF